MSELLLKVNELAKYFGERTLFSGVGFEIRRGEKVGLVGPNGAGKTTLLRCLLGRESNDGGQVTWYGGCATGYVEQAADFGGRTVLEELNKDYVMGARARGVKEPVVLYASVLKSSMLTIITLLALSIGSLLGGTAIIESIFMWDGVGKLAVDSIMMRDYPMIQAYVIWMALIYVGVNLATDIIYHYLDPRIRLEQEA